MCDGPSEYIVASLIIAAVSTSATVYGQQQTASAQYNYEATRQKEGDAAAAKNLADESLQEGIKTQQEDQQRVADLSKAQVQDAQTRAKVVTQAGDAGTAGVSVSELMDDYHKTSAFNEAQINLQAQNQRTQTMFQEEGYQSEAQSQEASFQFSPIAQPNYMAAAAQVGAAGVNAYNTEQRSED